MSNKYHFTTIFKEINMKQEDIEYRQEHTNIYFTILQYYRLKKSLQLKGFSNFDSIEELRKVKNYYIDLYGERYKFIQDDKEDTLYKVLRALLMGLKNYVDFMDSLQNDSIQEYFYEYNVYILIHLFYHIQKNLISNPFSTIFGSEKDGFDISQMTL